jgi:hypothetical protein
MVRSAAESARFTLADVMQAQARKGVNLRYIKHEGDKWVVYSEDGKVLGKHDTKEDAQAQLGAIEANKNRNTQAQHHPRADIGAVAPNSFSQVTEGPSMKTHEHRSHHRYMIGDKLRASQDHMEAVGMHSKEEHRAYHRKEAEHHMDGAMHLARMINESMAEGHADAPADAALTAGMIRSVPAHLTSDAAIVAKWDACQRAALPHAATTWRQAGESLGAADPEDLVVKVRASETIVAAHKALLAQKRAADAQGAEAERLALVKELRESPAGLSPGLEAEMLGLDPTDPKRERKGALPAWSPERLRRYAIAVSGAMPEIQTRAADLRGVDAAGKPAPVSQGAIPAPGPADRSAGQGVTSDLEAALLDGAARLKIKSERLTDVRKYG